MDRYCQYHIPRQVLGCECPDYPTRIRRQRRVHAHADPDSGTYSEPGAHADPGTESEPDAHACDANSGAIGITESESVGTKPVGHADSDTIGITKPDTVGVSESVDDS